MEKQLGKSYKEEVGAVSILGIAGNLALTLFKLAAGLLGHSSAMLSDALHSASDIAGGLIVLVGVSLSEKQADKEHPYGHERLECIASILLAVILLIAGLAMGYEAVQVIASGSYQDAAMPGLLALIAAVVSTGSKELMFWYTMGKAKKINSAALRAEAWHHRSDALSSVGALTGILGARLGLRVLDPIASLLICFFILKAAYDIFKEAAELMVDHSSNEDLEQRIRDWVDRYSQVQGVDLLHTREFGRKIYVDLEIRMDGALTLNESHSIAEQVHNDLETEFSEIKHVMIHVNPA